MTATRIYKVTETVETVLTRGAQFKVHLVDASSAAQAIRYCARNAYTAKAATPKDIAELMKAGYSVASAIEPEIEANVATTKQQTHTTHTN
jgi:hypothetical protein